jgi:hypothetical protein
MPTLQDIRYALRALRKSPGFFAVAVLTLGLGIGANSAIFSLVNAVLLRPLPYPNPEQLVGLGQWRNQQGEGYMQVGVSAPNIVDVASTQIFQQVAYFRGSRFNITGGDRPESIIGVKVSDELLPMFGIQPLMGRFFSRNELQAGTDQVAIIGYGLWKLRYASNPAILGKDIDLDERRYTIIGVMPANFRFTWDQDIDVFVPLVLTPEEESEKGRSTTRDLQTQARLKDGISIPHARQYSGESLGAGQALEIVGVVKDLRNGSLWSPNPDIYVPFSQHPNASAFLVVRSALPPLKLMPTIRNAVSALDPEQPINRVATLDQLVADQYGAIRFPMVLVWIFAALALALSAIGIFGVMSYTVSRRTQEMAIRMALGANAHQVRLLILREGLGVTFLGVAIGLMAALAMSRLMSDYVYGIKPADPVTFAAATVILIAVALLASYAPARRATRVDPIAALRHE